MKSHRARRISASRSGDQRHRAEGFDGFPVFHPDGTKLIFGSNRNMSHEGNTNLFLVEWLDGN